MLSNEDAVKVFRDGRRGNSKNIFHENSRTLYSYGYHFILAVRLNTGEYLINGDTYSSSTSRHTSLCIRYLQPNVIIPFSALDQVTRDHHLIEIVDRESDKYIPRTRKDPETGELIEYEEHRLGAAVIKFENKYYLSSIDDGAKGQGGYFLVELPENAQTVENAFDILFPKELNENQPHTRQGEFFFVPTDMKTTDLLPMEPRFEDKNNIARYFPNAGTGHAHMATEIRHTGEDIYVRGTIRHTEHKMLKLGKIWHRVYVNRAVRSFSAGGNVD